MVRWLQASGSINTLLLDGASESQTLKAIAEQVRELSTADCVAVLLGGQASDSDVVVRAVAGVGNGFAGMRIAKTVPVIADVLDGGEPLAFDDLGDHLPNALSAPDALCGPALAVALGRPARGVLIAARHKDAARFTADQTHVIAQFADQASVALELADKQRQQRQVAVLEERERIAADLHDQVIQRLYAAGMTLQGIIPLATHPIVRERINGVIGQLDETIEEIRTSIFDLHTRGEHVPGGLRRKVYDIVAETTTGTPVTPSVHIIGAVDTVVPRPVAEHGMAVLREALTNAVKHSAADTVSVLVSAGAELLVEVADDGVGITDSGRRSGLTNLDARAAEVGGELTVQDGHEGGTVLRWRVPLT